LQLARLDAADRLGFDLSEIHTSAMYHEARTAKSTAQVVDNSMAAEEVCINTKSMVELLKIGLFGVNATDSNGAAGHEDGQHR
jgi:hypothetical protein